MEETATSGPSARATWRRTPPHGRSEAYAKEQPEKIRRIADLHKMWARPTYVDESVHRVIDEDVNRFGWIREIVADSRLLDREKGVAFAIDLLVTSGGRPFRWTTVDGVAALCGYARQATYQALDGLEGAGWIESRRRRGPGGGLLLRLALPEEVAERIELRDRLRYGDDD